MAGEKIVFVFKVFSLFFSLLFFFLILIVESRLKRLRIAMSGKWERGDSVPVPTKAPLQKRWEAVMHKVYLKREADYKSAVLEADGIVEEVFRKVGFPSLDVALDQKKISIAQLSYVEELAKAHKQKNKLVKDQNTHITQQEALQSISVYESVLKEMQVID